MLLVSNNSPVQPMEVLKNEKIVGGKKFLMFLTKQIKDDLMGRIKYFNTRPRFPQKFYTVKFLSQGRGECLKQILSQFHLTQEAELLLRIGWTHTLP